LNQSTKSDLNTNKEFGLSVRVEINLPADGTKETYDNIFKSIKENLLGG
jgi:FKBP-type peptidyl-prolyl cis-trans isomerase (trigger factor)